jgi:hypothetical protein
MLFLVAIGAGLCWAGWVYLGPGTREGAVFVDALREHQYGDAERYAIPELSPRIRGVVHPTIFDGMDALAHGKGSRDYLHARANWTSRCLQFEGRIGISIVVVYVTLERRPEGWRVTEVSLDKLSTPICSGF